ncbi:hypothetical protein D3C77_316670 [compost metagenome]
MALYYVAYKELITLKKIWICFIFILFADPLRTYAELIPFQERIVSIYPTNNEATEVIVRQGTKEASTFTVKGNDVAVRDIFASNVDKITWDHQAKIAKISNNGQELVFALSASYPEQDNEVVVPSGWFKFEDGRVFINLLYLSYIFDRYAEFNADSEEFAWKNKLKFLDIEFIDTINSTPKDRMVHSFIQFTE